MVTTQRERRTEYKRVGLYADNTPEYAPIPSILSWNISTGSSLRSPPPTRCPSGTGQMMRVILKGVLRAEEVISDHIHSEVRRLGPQPTLRGTPWGALSLPFQLCDATIHWICDGKLPESLRGLFCSLSACSLAPPTIPTATNHLGRPSLLKTYHLHILISSGHSNILRLLRNH